MLLTEQTQAENKKIEKYKNAGYTELKQAAWKKKKKEDPSGDFVNVGTYYNGYKKSATPKPKKDPAPVQDPKQDPAPAPAPAPNPKQDQGTTYNQTTTDRCPGEWDEDGGNKFIEDWTDQAELKAEEFVKWMKSNYERVYTNIDMRYKDCDNYIGLSQILIIS